MYSITQDSNSLSVSIVESVSVQDGVLIGDGMKYDAERFHAYEIGVMPGDYSVGRYVYMGGRGFVRNPEYVEPNKWNLPNEVIEEIKNEGLREIQQEVVEVGKM